MKKIELLLPAGDEDCLRAAVSNGADAVYLGLPEFNARISTSNFSRDSIFSIVDYCHKHNVKVYVTLNTLIKNSEIKRFLESVSLAYSAKADAIIIQDSCLIPIIKKNFQNIHIHLSTQATITNSLSIPKGIDRVILARELKLEEIKSISRSAETEVFVHGALCFSYSGQCLFSSIVGGRSGNRGRCAQPCRKRYNNSFLLSTMDLCMLEKLPEIISSGIVSLKIEGRMRSPLYVATVARVYRKYIDLFYKGHFKIDQKDIDDLKVVFSREFTTGFAFNDSIVDSRMPMNRGLFIGTTHESKVLLKKPLKIGDGISIWIKGEEKGKKEEKVIGKRVENIIVDKKSVRQAASGDIIDISLKSLPDRCPVYKTSSIELQLNMGEVIKKTHHTPIQSHISLPDFKPSPNTDSPKIFVKVYSKKAALEADKAKADIIYYDLLKDDFKELKKQIKNSKLFAYTPKILSDNDINIIVEKIKDINPDGILVGNSGLLKSLAFLPDESIHLDYSFNCFNDIALSFYPSIPIISPELSFKGLSEFKNKNFICLIHGDIVLMTSRETIKAPELVDEEKRHFRTRTYHGCTEILNSKQLGLFNKARDLVNQGIRYFYIDTNKDAAKFIRIYKKIINGESFDDSRIRKGYTTGHFDKEVL